MHVGIPDSKYLQAFAVSQEEGEGSWKKAKGS
jgi:hypothetical protein